MTNTPSILLTILGLAMFFSCRNEDPNVLLEGKWASSDDPLYFIFSGDSMSYAIGDIGFPRSGQKRSGIVNETLDFVPVKWTKYELRSRMTLILDTLGKSFRDLASVNFLGDSIEIHLRRAELPIVLRRLKPNTSLQPRRIQLSSTGCYGWCPIFDLEITDNRVIYHGERFTKPLGYNVAWLNEIEASNIKNLVSEALSIDNAIQIAFHARSVDDAWNFRLLIECDKDTLIYSFNSMDFPSQFFPLLSRLLTLQEQNEFARVDTSFPFESRLLMMPTLNDSLEYLEKFYPKRFRPARFLGGETRLSRLFRRNFNPAGLAKETIYFTAIIDRAGKPKSIKVDNLNLQPFENALWKTINTLPPWQPALNNGKPVEVQDLVIVRPRL